MSKKQKMFSIIFKVIVMISAVVGVLLSVYNESHSIMVDSVMYKYFTIQSNIALAIICAVGCVILFKDNMPNRFCQLIKYIGTVSITLTGAVFCFVLAPTQGLSAWSLHNVLTHVVVPTVSIVDFLVVGKLYLYKKTDGIFVIIPPLVYVIYAGIGYVKNWDFGEGLNYPYFFLNWGSEAGVFGFSNDLPYVGAFWWIILLFVFLLVVGHLYLWFVHTNKPEKNS